MPTPPANPKASDRPHGKTPGPTFRGRLALEALFLALAVATMATIVVYIGTQRALRANLDNSLLSIAHTELSSVVDMPGGRIHVHDEPPTPLNLTIGAGYEKFAQIEDSSDRIIAQTSNLTRGTGLETDKDQEDWARTGHAAFASVRCAGQPCRALYYPMTRPDGRQYLAIIAIPAGPMDRSLRSLLYVLLVALALGAGMGTWGAYSMAGRLTRPLEAIAEAARTVGEENLSERMPDLSPDRELRDVTTRLNQMLGRLETAFEAQRSLVEAQRRFIADASHELRSPLAALRGTVEVALRRHRTGEDYRETLVVSLAEVQRLCRLVEDLLTLSRADSGRFSFRISPTDAALVIGQSVQAHEAAARRAGAAIRVNMPADLCVEADTDRVRQVLDNLLDNALRYAPPGSEVAVCAHRENGTVRVSVADCGPGLSEEQRARVFDRFYRADDARSRESGGMGLGLAIVKAIVEMHGGKVGVDSTPGAGATFWFTLPAG